MAIFFIIIGIILLKFMLNRIKDNLRFDEYITGLELKDNITKSYQILKDNREIENVEIDENNGLVSGQTKMTLLSWRENITIICMDNKVLINSKSDQPINILRVRLNINKIINGFESK